MEAADRLRRAANVVEILGELHEGTRLSYLEALEQDDPELRHWVSLALSRQEDSAPTSPEGERAAPSEDGVDREPGDRLPGERAPGGEPAIARFGPYRAVRLLGSGGMGTVYLAEREDDEFQRQVAVKVLRAGFEAEEARRRFLSERQILARLEHPNIARLYEGGTTPGGRPFLVMEHVDGRPIDRYCDEEKLSIRERVELLRKVCSAVQFAHRHLVVHRDLKPSNILVGADGEPKLLDFGIAKLLDPAAFAVTLEATRTGLSPMTPHFASPEQIRGEAITTASDVYTLGVVLYLLVAGRLPYRFPSPERTDMWKVLQGPPPARPSDALTETAEQDDPELTLPPLVERLGVDTRTLRGQLRRGLDNITLMALRLEPDRRYPSADHLAEDLRRYLDGRPVMAQDSTFGYQALSFLRRHRLGASLLASALLVLTTFSIVTARQSALVRQERNLALAARDQAEEARAEAAQVADFLIGLFEVASPDRSGGKTVSARELLDRGAERIDTGLADQPTTQAKMLSTIARVYFELSLYDEAASRHEQAIELYESAAGDHRTQIARNLVGLARALILDHDLERADQAIDRAAALQVEAGAAGADLAAVLNSRASAAYARGDYASAREVFRRSAELWQRVPDADPVNSTNALNNLALTHEALGQVEEAEAIHRRVLDLRRERLGPDHFAVGDTFNNLGALLVDTGRLEEGLEAYEQALDIRRRTLGPDDVRTGETLGNLGEVEGIRGNYAAAEELMRQSLEVFEGTFEGDHPYLVRAYLNLGELYRNLGRYPEARTYLGRSVEMAAVAIPEGHPFAAIVLRQLARLHLELGQLDQAELLLARARGILETSVDGSDPEWILQEALDCQASRRRGRLEEARRHCAVGAGILHGSGHLEPWAAFRLRLEVVRTAIAGGELEEAEPELAKMRELSTAWPENHPHRVRLGLVEAELAEARGRFDEAVVHLEAAIRAAEERQLEPEQIYYRQARERLEALGRKAG
ncbi:MAG: serine/threonine-protein kinase [Holophagales bacterium]|nr:serine/threonine-protein kinase [Holophagales bacterium]